MFNDNESPISLFSFQDIITSLTGIMIFFLLLFSLSILELTQKTMESSPVYEELKQIEKKNQILKQQISDISADIRTYRKRIKSIQAKDEATLTVERYRLERKIRELKLQKDNFDRKLKEEKEKYARLETENKKLKQKQEELERKNTELEKTAAEIKEKEKQISGLRKAIERRRKEVQITIDSSINKIPILIELSVDKICIFNTQSKSKSIISRKSPIISEFVADAVSHLRQFSPDKCYFVIMVKPSAANYISFFLFNMRKELRNATYGLEPILETEGVVNE